MAKEKKQAKNKKSGTRPRNKKETAKGEEVCEIFNIEKDGKEETIKSCGIEEEKTASKEQIKKENKMFRNIMIILGGFVLLFATYFFIMNSFNHFQYNGVNFDVDKTDMIGKTLYKTSLPVSYNGTRADYNFYLRGDPRITKNIPFDGNITFGEEMVLNATESFNCNGNGIIAVANVMKLYNLIGTKVIKDENATCDPEGRYMFVRMQEGNKTSIEQFGPSCYNINIKDCEILPGTERFMLETFVKINQELKQA
jgi:hypothetical protein